jgi:hypothetical protein
VIDLTTPPPSPPLSRKGVAPEEWDPLSRKGVDPKEWKKLNQALFRGPEDKTRIYVPGKGYVPREEKDSIVDSVNSQENVK